MSKHEELIKGLRASAATMPFDAAAAVQYRAAADALEAQAREIEGLCKEYDMLIQQMLEALETCSDSGYYPYSYDEELVEAAAAAARARLAPTPPTA